MKHAVINAVKEKFLLSFIAMSVAGCGSGVDSTTSYSVGGMVAGLSGSLELQNNGGDNLAVSADGNFSFATKVVSGDMYAVSVHLQPNGQHCSVSNATGTVTTSNISNVMVSCMTLTQMGGAMQGNPLSLSAAVSLFAGIFPPNNPGSADNAIGTSATFYFPSGATTDGINLYVADKLNNKIRRITIASGEVTTLAGSGALGAADNSTGTLATFAQPGGITTNGTNLYVTDGLNSKVRQIDISTGAVTTLAGSGALGAVDSNVGTLATFYYPSGITSDGNNLYVADTENNKIRQIVIATGEVTTLAGSGAQGGADHSNGALASFNSPGGITTDGANLFVVDKLNHKIRKIVIATGEVTTLAGSGAAGALDNTNGTLATFNYPADITSDGTNLFVADSFNHTIRQVVIATGAVTTIAGSGLGGALDNINGASAMFNFPAGITTDGSHLYVADTGNNAIRKIR